MTATIPAQLADGAPSRDDAVRAAPIGPAVQVAAATVLVPVTHRGRPIGAYVVVGDRVRYRPAVDLAQGVAALALVCGAGTAAAALLARRRGPAIGAVTMGPGGWISLRGVTAPNLRPTGRRRPWWARLLRAQRLVAER